MQLRRAFAGIPVQNFFFARRISCRLKVLIVLLKLFIVLRCIFTCISFITGSSHWRCSIKNAVLENFAIFTGKCRCWSLFLIKLQVLRPATELKIPPTQVFSCEYSKIFKNTCLEKRLQMVASVSHWTFNGKFILITSCLKIGKFNLIRSVFRTFSNIGDRTFCKNRLSAVHDLRKQPHLGCLTGFWVRLYWCKNQLIS